MSEREFRVASEAWPDADFEIRTTGTGLNFTGYAAVFDSPSEDLGGFRETIAPGAFAKTIGDRGRSGRNPIKMFQNHNWDIVLASTYGKEPTLRLSEDKRGLLADADLPDNEWGRPIRDAVERGDISSMSFGFVVPPKGDTWSDDGKARTLNEVRLFEVSPVTAWPAYPATSASVRHLADLVDLPEDELGDAVRALFTDEPLLADQHTILIRAINARYPSPVIDEHFAELRSRIEAKGRLIEAL